MHQYGKLGRIETPFQQAKMMMLQTFSALSYRWNPPQSEEVNSIRPYYSHTYISLRGNSF